MKSLYQRINPKSITWILLSIWVIEFGFNLLDVYVFHDVSDYVSEGGKAMFFEALLDSGWEWGITIAIFFVAYVFYVHKHYELKDKD